VSRQVVLSIWHQPSIRAQKIYNKMQEPPARVAATVPIDFLLDPTNLRRLTIALVLIVYIAAAARDQSFPSPAAGLINEVVANELTDRAQQRKWMYLIDKRVGEADPHIKAGGH